KIIQTEMNYTITLQNENVAQQKNTVACFTIETAHNYIEQNLNRDRNITRKVWLAEVLKYYITVNYLHNEHLTEKVEQTAIANISTTRGILQKREFIGEKDKNVNNETYQKEQSLKQV